MGHTLREQLMLASLEGDLSRLLELGSRSVGYPLLLGDETLNVLGWTGPSLGEGARWEDFIAAGYAPSFQWEEGRFAACRHAIPHGFEMCRIGSGWIVDLPGPVGIVAHLLLSGRDMEELPLPDGQALGLLCLSVRSCLNNRMGTLMAHPLLSGERLLLQMAHRDDLEEPLLRFQASAVKLESEGYFTLLLVDLEGYHPHRNSVATVREQLAQLLGPFSALDQDVLFFLCRLPGEAEETLWRQTGELLARNRLEGVRSPLFYRLKEFHSQYQASLQALRLRRCAEAGQALLPCERMHLYMLLDTLRRQGAPLPPLHPMVETLAQVDQKRGASYLDTLYAYLLHAQRPQPACAALHIHRNTLDYRLRRIEEFTGLDWTDGDLMFRLYFSLCVLRYDRLAEK